MREHKPPKILRCKEWVPWWLYPKMESEVLEFYNKRAGTTIELNLRDLVGDIIHTEDPHEIEKELKNNVGKAKLFDPGRIQRALYQKTGARYEPVDQDLSKWRRVD